MLGGLTVADATAVFFDELARRGHEPLLGDAVGSILFELVSDGQVETWRVGLDNGDVSVARAADDAGCVVRGAKELFDGIATGEVNAMAALLRGALTFQGDPELLVRLQRVFPSPPAGVAPSAADRP
jgi:putative sterol carrier protein